MKRSDELPVTSDECTDFGVLRAELAQMRADKDLLLEHWRDEQALRIKAEVALESRKWMPVASELPDDEITVLLASSDGEVYLGYHSGDEDLCTSDGWMFETLFEPMPGVRITHWADLPEAPSPSRP
jgi:hypothetical protein